MVASLKSAFLKIKGFYKVSRCLQSFRKGFLTATSGTLHESLLMDWIKNMTIKALDSLQGAFPEDSAALIKTAREYDDGMFEEL